MPATGSIQITWPTEVNVPKDTVKCIVKTTESYEKNCVINEDQNSITITGVFAQVTAFKEQITITLEGVVNP